MDGCTRPRTESSSGESSDDNKLSASGLPPAQTVDMLNDIAERCAEFGMGDSLLEKEALAAIREVGFAVRMISLPESLPRTTDLIFMNLITLEDRMYCIELTQRGWRVASDRHDSMNGDYRQLDLHTRYFETIYQLLNVISPEFRNQFANKLSNKLIALTNGVPDLTGT
uniref:GSKIP domain-containing protein n=1 Tax=Setaria digitata TaxID=48799 RepID=A0A915PP72_9BILA